MHVWKYVYTLTSGTTKDLTVPIAGQYMPTHASKSKNPIMTARTESKKRGIASAIMPTKKTYFKSFSGDVRSTQSLKADAPPMQHTIMVAKMKPNGGLSSMTFDRVGVQLKTKMYMEPSKSETHTPTARQK